ncbi:unnamed protein product [Adineta steineri]|uniref:Uncharacterized protein n=1 Tax=Adineta steineri TaxID=433720 RepID=A0A814PVX3_9BILA|nr:unnamed protein product [Adineta steineri]
MLDDPRTKARTFLESSSIVSELEDVLNLLIDEKPDDLHGFLANHFLHQSKQPQIASLILKRLTGPAGEPAVHIDLTVALRNRSQRYNGLTVNLSSGKLNAQTMKDYETFVNSPSLATIFNRVDLFDHTTIDELLANFRSEHVHEVPKVPKVTAPLEPESSTSEIIAEVSTLKLPATKQKPVVSPAVVVKTGGAPPPSQKRDKKDKHSKSNNNINKKSGNKKIIPLIIIDSMKFRDKEFRHLNLDNVQIVVEFGQRCRMSTIVEILTCLRQVSFVENVLVDFPTE